MAREGVLTTFSLLYDGTTMISKLCPATPISSVSLHGPQWVSCGVYPAALVSLHFFCRTTVSIRLDNCPLTLLSPRTALSSGMHPLASVFAMSSLYWDCIERWVASYNTSLTPSLPQDHSELQTMFPGSSSLHLLSPMTTVSSELGLKVPASVFLLGPQWAPGSIPWPLSLHFLLPSSLVNYFVAHLQLCRCNKWISQLCFCVA